MDALRLLVEDYSDRIETVMFPYNIVESQGEDLLRQARAKGIGTIAMKPLAGGNLDDWRLALRYVAASDAVDISIPGMGSVEEVERNAAAAENLSPLTAEEPGTVRRHPAGSWELISAARWRYCAPCTVGIDIPSNFLMVNYLRKYDLADWAKTRYEGLAHHAGECIECGVCESRAPMNCPSGRCARTWPPSSAIEPAGAVGRMEGGSVMTWAERFPSIQQPEMEDIAEWIGQPLFLELRDWMAGPPMGCSRWWSTATALWTGAGT